MKTKTGRQYGERVVFGRGIPVIVTGVDGTWQLECTMRDVSESGATLKLENGSFRGLNVSEFFILLSSVGTAARRCELDWLKGHEFGARFVERVNYTPKLAPARYSDNTFEI